MEATLPLSGLIESRPRPWIRGPAWDLVWILSALWLVPLVLVLSAGPGDPADGPLDTLYFALTALFWLGHRVGSTWLAYFTTVYRPMRRTERARFAVVPVVIAVVCFAVMLPPDAALPWTRLQRVTAFVIVDYLLITYHFASQHFGVLSLYRLRAGRGGSSGLRRLDRAYALIIGGALVVVAEIVAGTVFRIDVWVDPWLDPEWVASAAGTLRAAGTVAAAAAAVGMLTVEASSRRPSLPRAAYVVGLAGMVAVAFYARTPFVFLVLWSAQHWIVAVGLTTLVARGEPAPEGPRRLARALHAVNRRSWAVLLLLAATSVVLLPFLEVEGADDDGALYAHRLFGQFATGLRTSSWVPVLVAFGLTTAFLHYWLDRAVYRCSKRRVRAGRSSSPRSFATAVAHPRRSPSPAESPPHTLPSASASSPSPPSPLPSPPPRAPSSPACATGAPASPGSSPPARSARVHDRASSGSPPAP